MKKLNNIANEDLVIGEDGKLHIKQADGTEKGTGVEIPTGTAEVPSNVVLFEEIQDTSVEVPVPIKSPNGTTYYIHVDDEGVLTVKNVSGEIVWEGGGASIEGVYFISNKLTNIANSNTDKNILEGDSYVATLTPIDGYEISDITIKMGNTDITSTAYADGNINITNVTGNIVIIATATKIPIRYNITNNLTNATNSNSITIIDENTSYSAKISPNQDYMLKTVTVTMGGIDVTSTVYSDGNINISSVTGDVVITAIAKSTKVTPEDLGFTTLYSYDGTYDKDKVLADENVDDNGILNYNYTDAVTIAYYVHTLDGTSDVGRFDIFDARRFGWSIRAADGVATDNVTALGGLYKGRNYSNNAVSKIAGYTQGTGSQGKICLFTNSYNGGITEETNTNMHVRLLIIQGSTITAEQLCTIFGL